jgi:hypothetical protein
MNDLAAPEIIADCRLPIADCRLPRLRLRFGRARIADLFAEALA